MIWFFKSIKNRLCKNGNEKIIKRENRFRQPVIAFVIKSVRGVEVWQSFHFESDKYHRIQITEPLF